MEDELKRPQRQIAGDGLHRITLTSDEQRYSLQSFNGWDYVEIASATRQPENGLFRLESVYFDDVVAVEGGDVVDCLWALRPVILDEEPA